MLGAQWQIYSYMPGPAPPVEHTVGQTLSSEVRSEPVLPAFLMKTLKRVADKFSGTFESDRTGIDCKTFYLDVGYDEDNRIVRIFSFGVKDRDDHNTGVGKEVLQYFFASLAIYAAKTVDVTLWSVSTAIGFYLRCGMSIMAEDNFYEDPVEIYYNRKAELFGDNWDKYRSSIVSQIDKGELKYENVYPLFEASDFYKEGEHPGVFSMWLEDILGNRAHYMIYHIEPRRSAMTTFRV